MSIVLTKEIAQENIIVHAGSHNTIIQAVPKENYNLINQDTGLTPADIKAKRQGNDLILKSDTLDVKVTIKDFWEECYAGSNQCFAKLDVVNELGELGEVVITQTGPELQYLLAGQVGTLAETTLVAFPWWGVGIAGLGTAALVSGGSKSTKSEDATIIPADNIKDGSEVTATSKDTTGNSSTPSSDTVPIPGNITVSLANTAASDTGLSATDNYTKNTHPVITGKAPAGSTVTITIDPDNDANTNNDIVYTAVADANGDYSVDLATATPTSGALPASGLPEGTVGIKAETHSAGTTISGENTFIVDTTPPTPDIVIDSIATDNFINTENTPADPSIATVPVSGTVSGEFNAGDTVTLTVNNNNYTGSVDENGKFTIKVSFKDLTSDTDKTVAASINTTDKAGNQTTVNATPKDYRVVTKAINGDDAKDDTLSDDSGYIKNWSFEAWKLDTLDTNPTANGALKRTKAGEVNFQQDGGKNPVSDWLGMKNSSGIPEKIATSASKNSMQLLDGVKGKNTGITPAMPVRNIQGSYYVDGGKSRNKQNGIIQEGLSLKAGETYTLSFIYTTKADNSTLPASWTMGQSADNTFEIYWGKTLIAKATNSGSGINSEITAVPTDGITVSTENLDGRWARATIEIDTSVVSNDTDSLAFRTYAQHGGNIGLDNISLNVQQASDTVIEGFGGDDKLFGMQGDDILYGGEGNDVFFYSRAIDNGNDIIKDFTMGEDKIVIGDLLNTSLIDDKFTQGTAETHIGIKLNSNPANQTGSSAENININDVLSNTGQTITWDSGTQTLHFTGTGVDELRGSVVIEGSDLSAYTNVQSLIDADILVLTTASFPMI